MSRQARSVAKLQGAAVYKPPSEFLVPKLHLGMLLSRKLCFLRARRCNVPHRRSTASKTNGVPKYNLGTRRKYSLGTRRTRRSSLNAATERRGYSMITAAFGDR